MITVTSVLQVEDFAHWKRVWDESASAQEAGGILGYHVHYHPTDAQRFVVIREFADLGQARAYLTSDARKQRMQAARVVACEDYLPEPASPSR